MTKSYGVLISVWAVLAATAFAQSSSFPMEVVTGEIRELIPGSSASVRSAPVEARPNVHVAPQASATGPGIVYVCDPGIPASACAYLNSTIAGVYANAFTNTNATIYVTFGTTGLGMSQFFVFAVNYSDFRTALQQSEKSADDATAFAASVPAGDNPLNSAALVRLTSPLLRALGFASPSTAVAGIQTDLTSCANAGASGCYDGIITISKAFQDAGQLYYRTGTIALNQADFYTVVEHETDEILGTPSCAFGCTNRIYPSDLYRYQGNGTRSFAPGNNNSCFVTGSGNACFSLDGVHTVQQFNNVSNGEDAGDWVPSCEVVLVQNAAACGGAGDIDISPAAEIRLLDVIGYTRTGSGLTPVQAITSGTVTSGTCVAPPAVSQFTTTSPLVSVYAAVTGAQTGDLAWIFFIRPDGAYNLQVATISSVGANGAACFSRQLPIASQVAAGYPGDWTVLILWNESNTPLVTLHFQLTGTACAYSFGSAGQAIEPLGGQGVLNITVASGCPWTISGLPSWVTLLAPNTGSGRGSIPFTVPANAGAYRSGAVTLASSSFTFEQGSLSPPGLSAIGSLAQVLSQGAWTFSLTAANLGTSSASARFSFLADGGVSLPLPLTFPQSSFPTATLLGSTLDRTIPSNAQLVIQSTGPASTTALSGWGQLLSTGNISGLSMFIFPSLHWNAAVPLETRNAARYTLAFDNTTSGTSVLATGVAVANLAPFWADIPVVLRDDTGLLIGTATVSLPAQGHASFMLNQQYPATAGKRGTIEFDTPSYSNLSGTHAGQISVLGVRTNGSSLTTVPALASGDTPGGSIAHVTYNGGFTSTFHLVNTGSTTASFTLSFYDNSGSPLAVPVLLPQSGATMTTSALTQTLAAGAMLVVQTQANDALPNVSGSAQLKTSGGISGFEIFNWTTFGQEASVPLETRTPNSFVLLFDDTGTQTTGVALSNLAASAANVTVKIYSDTGTLLRTTTVNVPANGHSSFMLPTTYTQAAGRRGMAEFVVPQGGQLSVLGMRATSAGTLTTIPILAR